MNALLALLLGAALVLIQCLIGGTRFVYSFPSYLLIGSGAIAALFFLRRPASKPSSVCVASALALAAYVLLRTAFSPVPYLARSDAFMVAACLLCYLVVVFYLHASRPRLWIVFAILAVAMAHIVFGLIQFRELNGYMPFGFLRGDPGARASGMLICPNHLAGYLEAAGLLALSLTVWGRLKIWAKLVTGYLAAICLIGMMITGSRGGYLSITVGLLAFVALSAWVVSLYNRQAAVLTLLIALAASVLLLGGTAYTLSFNKHVRDRMILFTQADHDMRVQNWLATFDQIRQAPLLGTGAGTHLWYGRLFRRAPLQSDPMHSHNDYLEMLAEYGLVGEVLALFFLGAHLWAGFQAIRSVTLRRLCNTFTTYNSDSLALSLGAVCAVVAIAAHSVVDFNLHIPGNALLFAFLFGIMANPGLVKPQTPAWASGATAARLGAALGGVALIAAVAVRYPGEYLSNKAWLALGYRQCKDSVDLAKKAIEADPSNPFTFFYQGEAYRVLATQIRLPALRSLWFGKAIEAYHQGLALFPEDENTLLRLGQALDGAHDFQAAEEAYRKAIALDPNLGVLRAYYSTHLKLMGREEEAKAALAEAAKFNVKDPHTVGAPEMQSILLFDPAEQNNGSSQTAPPGQ